jgi:acetyl-CoA carboxylase biotin carboxyl carrier protein
VDIDLEELAGIVELLKSTDFSEFRYEKGDVTIVLRRGELPADSVVTAPGTVSHKSSQITPAKPIAVQAPAMPPAMTPVPGAYVVTAPLLGTFYPRPKPGEAPFVTVGDYVQEDTVVCIVEVMKLMNSVYAGRAGVIAAIHAQEGALVEFDQPLFSIVDATK